MLGSIAAESSGDMETNLDQFFVSPLRGSGLAFGFGGQGPRDR
jgi:hypothetical protein